MQHRNNHSVTFVFENVLYPRYDSLIFKRQNMNFQGYFPLLLNRKKIFKYFKQKANYFFRIRKKTFNPIFYLFLLSFVPICQNNHLQLLIRRNVRLKHLLIGTLSTDDDEPRGLRQEVKFPLTAVLRVLDSSST